VALVIFVLKPFKLEFVPEQKAAANENSLAVMYFSNLVDAEDRDKTAQMITSLLITGLSESQYLQVVSRQRLHDILRQLGKEGVASIDQNTASVVAAKAGVKWMITGDILQTQPRIVLAAEVSDVQSGRIVTTQRITGGPAEDLFAVTDKLSAAIRNHLSLSAPAKAEPSRPVAEVTTHSPEAYRFYLEGLDLEEKMYDDEAMVRYRKAIALDSAFAMAYLHLVTSSIHSGSVAPAIRNQWIAKGAALADRATWKEQRYLQAMAEAARGDRTAAVTEFGQVLKRYPQEKEAWKLLGGIYLRVFYLPEEALSAFRQVVAIDSLDKTAYNSLAYCYEALGEFDKSIEAINRYIALAPDEANPYDTRGDLYCLHGRIDDAIASYKKALELKPDFYSNFKLGLLYIYRRDYVHADSVSKAMAASSSQWLRSFGRSGLALSLIYRGRFRDGLVMFDQGIAADRLEQYEGEAYMVKLVGKVDCYRGMGQVDSALVELNRFQTLSRRLNPNDIDNGRSWQVELLVEKGELVQAIEVAAALQTTIEKADTSQRYVYQCAQGCIAFARGDYQTAVHQLESAVAASRGLEWGAEASRLFGMRYMLGRAYLTSGMLDRAVAEFEKAITRLDWAQAVNPLESVKCHYYLGQAYEQSGWKVKAIEQYQTFLDIWKDADRELPEIVDARARLAKLTS
jgi:tetratricopeptide (TPR) repeat protein